jgi:hypothetical protein
MNSFSFESLFPGEKMGGREAPALPFSFQIHQFLNLKREDEEVQEDKITTSQKEAEDEEEKTDTKVRPARPGG